MAFVSAVPLAIRPPQSLPACTSRPNRAIRTRRAVVRACEAMPTMPAVIRRARNPQDLHIVYAVWNAVCKHEGAHPLSPDEDDAAHTTVHLVARSPDGVAVGAARLVREAQNVRLDRVAVLPDWRGQGIARALVDRMLVMAGPAEGAVYVSASRGSEMAFYSILGFDVVGDERVENGLIVRTMMYSAPVCAPSAGCVGLHHTSIRVGDIEKSLAFYGSLGFTVSDKFVTSGGARACYVEGLGARLEFVETKDGSGGLAGVQGVPPSGFDRLVFDVTKACTDLESFLQHLKRRNGGALEIAADPAQQVLGATVVSIATISDPDGMPIEFFRTEAQVPGELRTRVSW